MGRLFDKATEQSSLREAWHKLRANGQASAARETRVAIEMFGQTSERNIKKIQARLRDNTFKFDPQFGALKKKSSGGNRGIVLASLHNRIVERALLDCLQDHSTFIKGVLETPTSIGGVPHRSVPHGLRLIRDAFANGQTFFVRSDISGFFDNIPRKIVLGRIKTEVGDSRLLNLLDDATTVTLINEDKLGENRKVFPTDSLGVAQGSPLSPLFGNITLHDFDQQFNGQGISCVRFIDDFVLLGKKETQVRAAFERAQKALLELGLNCHSPFASDVSPDKASFGKVSDGFTFLGYRLEPGSFQPSAIARQKILKTLDGHILEGKTSIREVRRTSDSFESRQRYSQTLVLIDKVLKGWGEAFSYGNNPNTIHDLDIAIDAKLNAFRDWFSNQIKGQDWKVRRRLGGICLLSDIKTKSLDELPFMLPKGTKPFRQKNVTTFYTDGSIAVRNRQRKKEHGPGGWAFVVAESQEAKSGHEPSSTNNRMELRAVIEAVRFSDPTKSIVIKTDSQYVCNTINGQNIVKSNNDLWREYELLAKERRIRVVWIKGHAGDPHNERADALAKEQAAVAKKLDIRTL
jgi:RNA-directed DNA polymerase